MEKFNQNLKCFLQTILILSAQKNFIIELKHFTTKPAKSGGTNSIEKISSKIWKGRPPPPLPPGSGPHESYYQVSAFRAVARLATVRGKEGTIENFLILSNICKNLIIFEWIFKNIWENLKKNLKNSKRFVRKHSQKIFENLISSLKNFKRF